MKSIKHIAVTSLATGIYSGFFPLWPGTFGTIPAWLIAWFLFKGDLLVLGIAAIVTTVLSVWIAGEAEKIYGHDARKIVIDEWAGMFIALLWVPFNLTAYLIAFASFRVYDVAKLTPARQSERLPGGWGITADDVVAGAYACLTTHLALYVIDRWF